MQIARTVNPIISIYKVTFRLNFCNKKFIRSISLKYRRGLNKTCYIDRRPSEKIQKARIVTLLQVITELLPFLIFAIIILSGRNISKSIERNLMKLDTLIEDYEIKCRMQES